MSTRGGMFFSTPTFVVMTTMAGVAAFSFAWYAHQANYQKQLEDEKKKQLVAPVAVGKDYEKVNQQKKSNDNESVEVVLSKSSSSSEHHHHQAAGEPTAPLPAESSSKSSSPHQRGDDDDSLVPVNEEEEEADDVVVLTQKSSSEESSSSMVKVSTIQEEEGVEVQQVEDSEDFNCVVVPASSSSSETTTRTSPFRATAANTAPPVPEPDCWHGALPRLRYPEHAQGMKRAEALNELLQCLQVTMRAGAPFSIAMKTFVTEPQVAPIVDDDLIKCALSHAVNKVLQNQLPMAKLLLSISMALEAAKGRVQEFGDFLDAALKGQIPTPVPDWYREWNAQTANIYSEQDVVVYLHKKIPCQCLAARATTAMQAEKTKVCHYCRQVHAEQKLLICARCKIVRYCSKDCQVKDWKEHKAFCKSFNSGAASSTAGQASTADADAAQEAKPAAAATAAESSNATVEQDKEATAVEQPATQATIITS